MGKMEWFFLGVAVGTLITGTLTNLSWIVFVKKPKSGAEEDK